MKPRLVENKEYIQFFEEKKNINLNYIVIVVIFIFSYILYNRYNSKKSRNEDYIF